MTRRTKLILLGMTGALLAVGTFFATAIYQTTRVVVPNAYAVWWTADLVIEHMERNQGAWPRNWDELRLTSQQAYQGTTSTNREGTRIAEFRPRASIEEAIRVVNVARILALTPLPSPSASTITEPASS